VTISSSAGAELTVGQVVTQAYRRASLLGLEQDLTSAESGNGRIGLGLVLMALEAEGLDGRIKRQLDVTLTSGTSSYTLAAGYSDVSGEASYTPSSAATPDSSLSPITREEWTTLLAKDASGTPTLYFVDKSRSQPVIHLWPTPDEAGTVQFQASRSLADVDSDQDTLDLQRYWLPCIIALLAADLAEEANLGAAKVSPLRAVARMYLTNARAESADHGETIFYTEHDR